MEILASMTYRCLLEWAELVKKSNMHSFTGIPSNPLCPSFHLICYRSAKLKVSDSCIYPDPGDLFIREPFIVKFSTKAIANTDSFVIIAIHTQPKV